MMEIRLANRHEAEVCYQCIENARAKHFIYDRQIEVYGEKQNG